MIVLQSLIVSMGKFLAWIFTFSEFFYMRNIEGIFKKLQKPVNFKGFLSALIESHSSGTEGLQVEA